MSGRIYTSANKYYSYIQASATRDFEFCTLKSHDITCSRKSIKWPLFGLLWRPNDFLLCLTICYGPDFVAIVNNENGSTTRPRRDAAHPQVSWELKGESGRSGASQAGGCLPVSGYQLTALAAVLLRKVSSTSSPLKVVISERGVFHIKRYSISTSNRLLQGARCGHGESAQEALYVVRVPGQIL